jgi:hypothetical protein
MPSISRLARQPYELFTFARKYRLSIDAARTLIDHFGADREGADSAALRLCLLGRRDHPTRQPPDDEMAPPTIARSVGEPRVPIDVMNGSSAFDLRYAVVRRLIPMGGDVDAGQQ